VWFIPSNFISFSFAIATCRRQLRLLTALLNNKLVRIDEGR